MRKLTWLLFLLFPALVQGQNVPLDSCYAWARENYPKLKNRQVFIETNTLRIKNLRTNFFPKIDFNAQAHYQSDVPHMDGNIPLPLGSVEFPSPPLEQFKLTLDIQQVIYDGGVTKNLKELEQRTLESQDQQLEVELFQLNKQVNDLFFTILLLKKQKELLAAMEESLNNSLGAVKSGVANGVLTAGSEDELQVGIMELQQKQTQADHALKTAFSILTELTGKILDSSTTLTTPEISLSDDFKRPELKLFETQKSRLQQLSTISKGSRLPKLGAFAQLGYGNPALNMLKDEWKEFYIVGARLQWNIYDWGSTKRKQQEYTVQQHLVDNQQEGFIRNINIARTKERMKQQELHALIKKDKEITALHERIRKRSEVQLANGVITTSDYIKKLTAETQAKLRLDMHQLELIQSKVRFNTINGH